MFLYDSFHWRVLLFPGSVIQECRRLYQMGVISHLVYKALIHQTLTNQYNGKQKSEQENLANGACELQ